MKGNVESSEKCVICDKDLSDGATVEVTKRRRATLEKSGEERGTPAGRTFRGKNLVVHDKCYNAYTNHRNVAAATRCVT